MRRGANGASLVLVLAVLATLVVSGSAVASRNPAYAQQTPSSAQADPSVTAGILLLGVQQVNLNSGTFGADFYLWFNSTGSPQTVQYELINGQATSVTVDANSSTYQEYRIVGTFSSNLDFSNFPFENHSLSIQVESKNMPSSQLTFVPDTAGSGVDPSVSLVGWNLLGSSIQAAPHAYSASQSFSRLTFTFTIARPVVQSFMTNILPIVLITLISLLAFFLPPTRSFERILIGVTTLIAAVQFNLFLLGQIPPVNYLTVADKMMITVYALFLYSIGVTIILARQVENKDFERAKRLNTKGAILVPFIAAVILGFLLLLGYTGL
jgi:hypothetical protein